jgi:hypothetical protein
MKIFLKTFFSLLFITQTYSQWMQQSLPTSVDVWGLANKDSILFAGTEIGFQQPGYVFRSTDFGISWDTLTGLPFTGGWSFAFSDSILVAGSFGSGIYFSSDLGNTWIVPDSGITQNENVHTVLKHKSYVFAGTADLMNMNGVFRSSDNGRSWIAVNTGLPSTTVISLASNGQNIYAGTGSTGEVYCSTNDGMSWFSASNGLPDSSGITFLVARDNKVFAGVGISGVYYSSDNGTNWTSINSSISFNQVWTLALADTSLFVGSLGSGIFLTQDNGISWTQVNEGLTNLDIRSLLVTGNNYLFAGTTNGFVCYRPLSEMITYVKEFNDRLSAYNLSQCFPNPFNPITKIKYQIPEFSFVSIKVYDVIGRKVSTLVDEEQAIGSYEVEFDGSSLPSGVYFYTINAGDLSASSVQSFIQTKKMILLK